MRITVTPVMSASPDYVAGDAIGSNAVALTPLPLGFSACKVVSIHCRDAANQGPALKLLFFKSDPEAAGTPATITDNAAFAYGTSAVLEIGKILITAGDWDTIDSKKSCLAANIQGIGCGPGEPLYFLPIANGAYNGAATDDLSFEIGLEPMVA